MATEYAILLHMSKTYSSTYVKNENFIYCTLTLIMLRADAADGKFMIYFLFFLENSI